MTVILNGKRFAQFTYPTEKEFEGDIVVSSRTLFGPAAIYIDAKKKLESKTLGNVVPDGFLFDFTDPQDPLFYIVEVELSQHGFYAHIFPQITKFFAFFRNGKVQKNLADRLHAIIDEDKSLKTEFKAQLGTAEVYKFLSDTIESSQNILLISDGTIDELPEIMETYSDTWGKMVKSLEIRKYTSGSDTLFSIAPDLETLPYVEPPAGSGDNVIGESYHLEKASEEVRNVYKRIKDAATKVDARLGFNPQKYYISIKADKNIAFLEIRKSKIRFIALLPEVEIRKLVPNHTVVTLSEPVQRFYNSPCASIDVADATHFAEIEAVLNRLASEAKWGT